MLVGRVHIEFDCTDIFYFAQPCFERATGNSCLVEVAVALLQLSAYSDIDVEKGVDRTGRGTFFPMFNRFLSSALSAMLIGLCITHEHG